MPIVNNDPIDTVVVHCSATSPRRDIGAAEINSWHVQRGWSGIGYHYVIRRNGEVEVGRPETTMGAHVRGNNENSLGICLIGGVDNFGRPEFNYTLAQMHALRELKQELDEAHNDPIWLGHRDLDSTKACPCFDVPAYFALD